jgi:hypothetical protein
VNSYARSQGVSGGLVLKPPKVSDGGGNLDFSFKPGQEGASFDDKSWSWQKGEAPPPASTPAAAAGEPIEPATESCTELEAAGFEYVKTERELPWQHVLIFRKPVG